MSKPILANFSNHLRHCLVKEDIDLILDYDLDNIKIEGNKTVISNGLNEFAIPTETVMKRGVYKTFDSISARNCVFVGRVHTDEYPTRIKKVESDVEIKKLYGFIHPYAFYPLEINCGKLFHVILRFQSPLIKVPLYALNEILYTFSRELDKGKHISLFIGYDYLIVERKPSRLIDEVKNHKESLFTIFSMKKLIEVYTSSSGQLVTNIARYLILLSKGVTDENKRKWELRPTIDPFRLEASCYDSKKENVSYWYDVNDHKLLSDWIKDENGQEDIKTIKVSSKCVSYNENVKGKIFVGEGSSVEGYTFDLRDNRVREIGYLTDTEYVYGYETRVEAALAMKYITSQVEG